MQTHELFYILCKNQYLCTSARAAKSKIYYYKEGKLNHRCCQVHIFAVRFQIGSSKFSIENLKSTLLDTLGIKVNLPLC